MIDRIQERLAAACQADGRLLAAFVYGSHVAGTADEHSDVDLCLIVADGARLERIMVARLRALG